MVKHFLFRIDRSVFVLCSFLFNLLWLGLGGHGFVLLLLIILVLVLILAFVVTSGRRVWEAGIFTPFLGLFGESADTERNFDLVYWFWSAFGSWLLNHLAISVKLLLTRLTTFLAGFLDALRRSALLARKRIGWVFQRRDLVGGVAVELHLKAVAVCTFTLPRALSSRGRRSHLIGSCAAHSLSVGAKVSSATYLAAIHKGAISRIGLLDRCDEDLRTRLDVLFA